MKYHRSSHLDIGFLGDGGIVRNQSSVECLCHNGYNGMTNVVLKWLGSPTPISSF